MRFQSLVLALIFGVAVAVSVNAAENPPATLGSAPARGTNPPVRYFDATGIIEAIGAGSASVVIRHDAISNLMDAMTMEFKVKDPASASGVAVGDRILFRLAVSDAESWVDRITKTNAINGSALSGSRGIGLHSADPRGLDNAAPGALSRPRHPLLDYRFTNELGQAVSLGQFSGQALAITFFFTRCPIPEYCPRLSRNFQAAAQKLAVRASAPTNWHFLSVTIDPGVDTPAVLKAYAQAYEYDPAHWSFLTGAASAIADLARESGATFEPDNGFFNHNFRTLIVDASGRLQMVVPTSGDLSEAIVQEILKAAVTTNGIPRVVAHP
jgi:protein SCO1/2